MNKASIKIEMLSQDHDNQILELIFLLNPSLDLTILQQRLTQMWSQGYQCAGIYVENQLAGLCGIWETTRFYSGKQLELDNVIVRPTYQKHGIGKALMIWVEDYAKSIGALTVELNAYTQNTEAHRFYIRGGYDIIGYHFQKPLVDCQRDDCAIMPTGR